ncbi:MAG: GNAT family N-acetyltransferase, partial [Clostridiales bacterium]|nr:GNAT family N-acetyltransferase [Clostridiales bacterium]
GRGYAVKLMEHAIKKAKEAGARRVFLYTNSKLAPALSLYKKLGFTQVDRGESKYPSADMEFELII